MKHSVILSLLLLAFLTGCNKQAATGQSATLALKDGTTVAGTVTKSDASSITIQTPSGVVSTYPLTQVASVTYTPGAAPNSAPPAAPADQQQAATQPPPVNPAPGAAPPSAPPSNTAPAEAPPNAPPTASPAVNYTPAETFRTIPAGRTIAIRTDAAIDSDTAAPGQTFSGTVARDVLDSNGNVAIPRGSSATLVVRDATAQGRVQGRSELVLDVAAVRVQGHRYRLETGDFVQKGREGVGANKRTATFAGGGGLFGTIVGAIAGGGKGAAIGALSGAAAGTAAQAATRGHGARIPAETVLNFQLEAPIHIREML